MGNNTVEEIADFVLTTSLDDIEASVQDAASRVVTDTIGVMLAGTTGDVAAPMLAYLEKRANSGPSRVIGWGTMVAPDVAALVNGTLGHALDYDDVIEMYPGHPSSVAIATLLAFAEPDVQDGAEFLEAYALGIEVGAKIGNGIGIGHYLRGWHATATLGIFAAVAALAKLKSLSRSEIVMAFGIAGSLAAGLRCNFGTMTKPLHSGWAAHAAVNAVELASVGWTANEDILDAKHGFFGAFGDENSSSQTIASSLGKPFIFASPGVGLKRYPCYNGIQRAIDATREMLDGLDPGEIKSVVCRVPPGRLKAVLYSRPNTALEAKFSYEYVIAATILDGSVGLNSFTEEAVHRPEIHRLVELISVVEDPQCAGVSDYSQQAALGTAGYMEVTLSMESGDQRRAAVTHGKGSAENQLSWDEVIDKFSDCAEQAGIGTDRVTEAAAALRHIQEIKDMGAVVRSLNVTTVNAQLGSEDIS